jgi:putative DNA primase/helicase
LIPFRESWDKSIPNSKTPDLHLREKLLKEASGILNWIIEGVRLWDEIGLTEPPVVANATAEYKKDADTLGDWIEERCIVGAPERVFFPSLYESYVAWSERHGLKPMSSRAFSGLLSDRGFETHRSNSVTWKLGLRLKTDPEMQSDINQSTEAMDSLRLLIDPNYQEPAPF